MQHQITTIKKNIPIVNIVCTNSINYYICKTVSSRQLETKDIILTL